MSVPHLKRLSSTSVLDVTLNTINNFKNKKYFNFIENNVVLCYGRIRQEYYNMVDNGVIDPVKNPRCTSDTMNKIISGKIEEVTIDELYLKLSERLVKTLSEGDDPKSISFILNSKFNQGNDSYNQIKFLIQNKYLLFGIILNF